MRGTNEQETQERGRANQRIHTLRQISLNYEGRDEHVAVRPPDISPQGMFVNTQTYFPEGAILNLTFRLGLSGAEVSARGEVRYCLRGVGVGVEFIALSEDARRLIEQEQALTGGKNRRTSRTRRTRK